MISPDFDTYGKFARGSLLADYCELLALRGSGPTAAQLAAYIEDNDWDLRPLILRSGQERQEAVAPDPEEAADAIFEFIEARRQVLGDGYPFQVMHGHLAVSGGQDLTHNSYLALLAVATVHAYKVPCDVDPRLVFEHTVVDVINARGFPAAPLGDLRRGGGTFEAAVEAACNALGLTCDSDAVARRRFAHDAGIDAIVHLSWGDTRAGAFVWIGQITCARSDEWDGKIMEPAPAYWARVLGARTPPVAFLAVPHHVEALLMDQLLDARERPILDRLRILKAKQGTSADETTLIRSMLEAEVERI